jgi:hypothetical protein
MAETEIDQRKDDGKIKSQINLDRHTVRYQYLRIAIFPTPLGSHYRLPLRSHHIDAYFATAPSFSKGVGKGRGQIYSSKSRSALLAGEYSITFLMIVTPCSVAVSK